MNKFSDDIEKCERSVGELESQCESEVKEEQDRDERINAMKQEKNKLENDLEHLVNNVGTGNIIDYSTF